jgi:hypothetical protein
MATKKKTKKKTAKPKKSATKKATSMKAAKPPKTTAKRRPSPKSAKLPSAKKKKKISGKKIVRQRTEQAGGAAFVRERRGSRSGEQSGDLQGLARGESADSESVDELLEEGNAFEAEAVMGVEDADLADEKEVRTHEVPEDDVPSEYLDED